MPVVTSRTLRMPLVSSATLSLSPANSWGGTVRKPGPTTAPALLPLLAPAVAVTVLARMLTQCPRLADGARASNHAM